MTSFNDLTDAQKEAARDKARLSYGFVNDEWWSDVYEDVMQAALILGIDISRTRRGGKHREYFTTDITFSGFDCQGDGASFEGSYTYNPQAVEKMAGYTADGTLNKFANELALLQVARKLKGHEPLSFSIVRLPSYYLHSGCMSLADFNTDYDESSLSDDEETTFLGIMRRFADWIYDQLEAEHEHLEAEHEHLTSDESVDAYLADQSFDSDGVVI